MSKHHITSPPTRGGEQSPPRQRPKPNFKTPALNELLRPMIGSTASEKQEREDLLHAITRLKEDHGAVDDVVKLLTHVVEKGKLPHQTTSSSRSGSASGSSSSSSDSPDNDDDDHEKNNNDNKKVTLEEALQLIKELTPQKSFASVEIIAIFRGANGLKYVKNEVKDIDDEVRKMTECEQIIIQMPRVQGSGNVYFDDKSNTEEAVLDALLQAKAIESRPLNKHRVKGALEKAIKRVLSSGSEEYINYTPGLVTTEPKIPNLDVATDDCTKAVVLVVAGESGSGKSRYAVGALAEENTALLRYSLRKDDFDRNEDEHTKKQEKETESEKANKVGLDFNRPTEEKTAQTLRALIEVVTSELFHYDLGQYPIYESIRSVAKSVNKNRNTWAFKKAKEMIEVAIENVGSEDISRWYKYNCSGEKATVKLDKLVIVFDECGVSPDFVAGIIATARDCFLPFLRDEKGLARNVGLVLCGSGLEAVKTGTIGNKYVGSDPALTDVVIMRTTALEKLPDQELRESIEKGVFARVLAGNARMLTQGLIPALSNELVVGHVEMEVPKLRRRIAFGSFRYAMDFCVRRYVHLNWLRNKTADERSKLLDHSFRFLMRSALLGLKESNNVAGRLFTALTRDGDGERDEALFRIGLATRDPVLTSNALKYLACDGATEYLYSADGYAFEIVLAAHLERYYAAAHGMQVMYFELKHAWPPAVEKNASLDEEDIKERVKQMVKKGQGDIDVIEEYLRKMLKDEDDKKVALILRQGVPNAQGADVLLFLLERTDSRFRLKLSVFQAKNWVNKRYASAMKEAALSIGIDAEQNTAAPTTGSAGYSYQATMSLGGEVAERLKQNGKACVFELKNRAIVFAYGHSERSNTDMNAFKELDSDQPELWSREMLEPTISALVVAEDSDESEPNPES